MPTEANEVYECEICGAVVEVKEGGAGDLECCGQPMTLKEQNKTEHFYVMNNLTKLEITEGNTQ